MKPRWIFAIGALVLFVGARPIHAQWSTDPTVNNAICTAANFQATPTIISDGAGGAIITWFDYRNGYPDIYAQRINASGVVQWTADGVAACVAANHQNSPTLVSDGAGGAIITWYDYRSGSYSDIYAQRIDAAGAVQWTAGGVALCTAANSQYSTSIVSDGAGGAIITWLDFRGGSYSDIYAQRINAAGVVQWAVDGVALCTAANHQYRPLGISDGDGGVIITWYDYRSGNGDIYAQRIDASGVVQWTLDGVAISTAAGSQGLPTITADAAGGAIITWQDHRSGSSTYNPDVYAQRINAAGVVQWTTDGVAVGATTNWQEHPVIVSDGAGGAILTWEDSRGYSLTDIYAQRINANGVVQWAAGGAPISTASNGQSSPWLVSDGVGGAIIMWNDYRNGTNIDIYAQRINASGVVQWTSDGAPIATARDMQITTRSGPQYLSTLASDGSGGAIFTWVDSRIAYHDDIYAQRVRSDGTLGGNSAPLAEAGTAQTVIVNETVQLDGSGSSDPDGNPLAYAWTIASKPVGSSMMLSGSSIVTPTFVVDVAGEYKISLVVNDGFVNSAADEVLITAITAQDATQSLIDQVLALNMPQGNGLIGKLEVVIKNLDNNDPAKAIKTLQDFIAQVNVFLRNGTFTAEEGQPLIEAASEIIAALQVSLPKRTQIAASPSEYRLEQNSPNPFNPSTMISFALPEAKEVRLAIYSMSGRLVRTLVANEMTAGRHSFTWDAMTERGERVASGVYLCVLKAGEFTAQRKLVLMK